MTESAIALQRVVLLRLDGNNNWVLCKDNAHNFVAGAVGGTVRAPRRARCNASIRCSAGNSVREAHWYSLSRAFITFLDSFGRVHGPDCDVLCSATQTSVVVTVPQSSCHLSGETQPAPPGANTTIASSCAQQSYLQQLQLATQHKLLPILLLRSFIELSALVMSSCGAEQTTPAREGWWTSPRSLHEHQRAQHGCHHARTRTAL